VLEFGAYDAVAHFNIVPRLQQKSLMNLVPGQFFEYGVGKADMRQVKKADHRNTPSVKKRRKILRGQKKKKEDNTKEKESTTYKAGAF
jgi:hypothetical protein